jgi:hypothetical protein
MKFLIESTLKIVVPINLTKIVLTRTKELI